MESEKVGQLIDFVGVTVGRLHFESCIYAEDKRAPYDCTLSGYIEHSKSYCCRVLKVSLTELLRRGYRWS